MTSATMPYSDPSAENAGAKPSDPVILLAEDNQLNQKLAAILFRKLGYPLKMVSTGRQAVEEAIQARYDLIFMDVHMPDMDGLEATSILKEKLGVECPAIVALTASVMEEDRERIITSGMDDYMSKPIDFAKLKDIVERYVLS